jgi:alpha-mannosidase
MRVLVWIPWTGYAMSHVMKLDTQWVNKYQARLDEIGFPHQISYIRWAGHGDNGEPDPEICEFVKKWNQEYEWPRFSISQPAMRLRHSRNSTATSYRSSRAI